MEIDEFWQRYMNANFSSIFNRSTLTVLPTGSCPAPFRRILHEDQERKLNIILREELVQKLVQRISFLK